MPYTGYDDLYCEDCGKLIGWGEGDFNCTVTWCVECFTKKEQDVNA